MFKRVGLLVLVLLMATSISVFAGVEVGDQLVDFAVTDVAGNESMVSDYWSNYTLIDVWATWCGPCVKAMKSYTQNYDKFEQAGIKIVAISVDSQAEAPFEYAEKNNLPFTILHTSGKLAKEHWGVRGIPTMFLVDAEGKIVFKEVGFTDFAGLWKELDHVVDLSGVATDGMPKLATGSYKTEPVTVDYNAISANLSLTFVNYETKDLTAEFAGQLTKEPEYATAPLYGVVSIAGHEYVLAGVDTDGSGWLDQLYVDFNENKDLTDDKVLQYEQLDGYNEVEFTIDAQINGQTVPVIVTTYSYDSGHKYYHMNGLGYQAAIKSDGEPVKVLLLDGNLNGQYTDADDSLLMDLSGNGIFDSFSTLVEWGTLEQVGADLGLKVLDGGKEIVVE